MVDPVSQSETGQLGFACYCLLWYSLRHYVHMPYTCLLALFWALCLKCQQS